MKTKLKSLPKICLVILLAVVLGVICGGIDFIFGTMLIKITDFRTENYLFLVPFLALAGLFIIFIYQKFGKNSDKGMGLVFACAKGEEKEIPLRLIPLITVSTWLTHLLGGSAGREGVAVQIGGTVGNNLGKLLKNDEYRKILLISGMAAGFSGLFQTPLAAVFFALEVVMFGRFFYKALFPAFIASITACITSASMGLEKFSVDIDYNLPENIPTLFKLCILGVAFGLAGLLFSSSLKFLKGYFADKIKNKYIKIAIISICLSVVLILLWNGRYCGLGTNIISYGFNGEKIYYWDWILKILLTVLTLSAGFQGGEVTPLFAIGVSLGYVMGIVTGLPVVLCCALGYVAVFGSATNTLIAPILIGCEVFGFECCPAFVVVCVVSKLCNFNKSIYSQTICQWDK